MWFTAKKQRIYLDYASATPVLAKAAHAVQEAFLRYGNPGAIHAEGVEARQSLTASREAIARGLGSKAREIVFVSGGTEANNLSILGVARKLQQKGSDLSDTHWLVSSIEHPSVLECFSEIERLGGKVSHVDPDARGTITVESVLKKIKENTVFVSIGWANHEIGTIQPIRDIVRAIRGKHPGVLVHSDAGQAPLYLFPQVHTLDVDLLSLDSGKLYGPRGIGAVYISNRVDVARIMMGGGQERGLRAGTENVALAAGFACALDHIAHERGEETKRVKALRATLMNGIRKNIPAAVINGDPDRTLPHMLNISVPDIQSEYVTLALDHAGISISTKSACREGEEARSHVVEALVAAEDGRETESWRAQNTLRFSLGRETTERDVAKVIDTLAYIITSSAARKLQ